MQVGKVLPAWKSLSLIWKWRLLVSVQIGWTVCFFLMPTWLIPRILQKPSQVFLKACKFHNQTLISDFHIVLHYRCFCANKGKDSVWKTSGPLKWLELSFRVFSFSYFLMRCSHLSFYTTQASGVTYAPVALSTWTENTAYLQNLLLKHMKERNNLFLVDVKGKSVMLVPFWQNIWVHFDLFAISILIFFILIQILMSFRISSFEH